MTALVQLLAPGGSRRTALVSENALRLIDGFPSVYELARRALADDQSLAELAAARAQGESIPYGPVYEGQSQWRLLPPLDHPGDPARCLVTGTGLTHSASAANRQAMHEKEHGPEAPLSDSMKMYRMGLEGGRPEAGAAGVQPEWFYKGCGTVLRAHGEALVTPAFGLDGGEEAEVAGCYIIGEDGRAARVGMAQANEFSDHILEEQNYLYLAPSKLRTCSLGPEIIIDPDFLNVHGYARIERSGRTLWKGDVFTGEENMSHTVANLEHHHFKYPQHRRPGDAHIYFYGADAFSYGDNVRLEDGDIMEIALNGFGRPLRNPAKFETRPEPFVPVRVL